MQEYRFIQPLYRLLVPCLLLCLSTAEVAAWNDRELDQSIQQAVRFLSDAVDANGRVPSKCSRQADGGAEALTALALSESAAAADNPKFTLLLTRLGKLSPNRTYARTIRALLYFRLGKDYTEPLQKDVAWLLEHQTRMGGWGETGDSRTGNTHDTGLALIALDKADLTTIRIAPKTWSGAWKFVRNAQNPDGGFGYAPPWRRPFRFRGASNAPATARMLAAIRILQKKNNEDAAANNKAFARAYTWLTKNGSSPSWHWGPFPKHQYADMLLTASEICHPWWMYRKPIDADISRYLAEKQMEDGGWDAVPLREDRIIATASSLRTITRARKPILINKMMLGKGLQVNFQDAANLCTWIQRRYGYDGKWQFLGPDPPAYRLNMAPILYITGAGSPNIPVSLTKKIRSYIADGGSIIIQPPSGSDEFAETITDFFKRNFHKYDIQPTVPATHAIMKTPHPITGVTLSMIQANGSSRIFLFKSNLAESWSGMPRKKTLPAYRWFENLVMLTTGKNWRKGKFNLSREALAATDIKTKDFIEIARITRGADWPDISAVTSAISTEMARSFNIGVKNRPVELGETISRKRIMAWISGNSFPKLNSAQQNALKAFCSGGGIILIDPLTAKSGFFKQARKAIGAMFNTKARRLSAGHPLVTGNFAGNIGCDLRQSTYNASAAKITGKKSGPPPFFVVTWRGRIAALLSPYAVAGSVMDSSRDAPGYDRNSALRIAMNVVLYAAASKEDALE